MTEEEFLRWRDDPVTKWVFRALITAAEAQREQWLVKSWETPVTNPTVEREMFNELRVLTTRADAYRAIIESDYHAFCQWNGAIPHAEPVRA